MIPLKRIHVLKPDQEAGITLDHVRGLAGTYGTNGHRAPIVLGHPKDNSPAWGWVTACELDGENLYCDADVTPEFKELLDAELFRERSVAFYNSDPPALRHIGFLGATPPKIKGLEPIQLSEDEPFTTKVVTMPQPTENTTATTVSDFSRPVVLYALSEALPGIKASNLTADPQVSGDTLTGSVELGEKSYSYTISKATDGSWKAETTLRNPEVITLSEQVAELRSQLSHQKAIATVDKFYSEHKLTDAILPKSEAVQLVTLCEGTPAAAIVQKLLANLPSLVSDTPVAPTATPTPSEFQGFQLSDTALYQQVLAKAADMGLDASDPQNFTKALNSL